MSIKVNGIKGEKVKEEIENMKIRIGLDIDNTITKHPKFFSNLSEKVKQAGGKIFIITSRINTPVNREITKKELIDYFIEFDVLHMIDSVEKAEEKKVDIVMLSPVNETMSHPGAVPLGWRKFKQLVEKTNIPAYALGGMTEDDIKTAKTNGAHGIAAIGLFWDA